jgi:hypothetical protein
MSTRTLRIRNNTGLAKSINVWVLSLRVIAATLMLVFTFSTPSIAAGNPKATKSKEPAAASTSPSPSPTSNWILPAEKNKNQVVVQAGRALPVKFELVQSGAKIATTDMVQISTVKLASCNPSSTKAAPVVIVSPKPVPTVSTSASASSSPKESNELRNDKGTFSYVWKVPKSLATGCYQLQASKGDVLLASPIINVKGSK